MNPQNGPGYPEALEAARYLRARSKARPRVGIILGSGLGDVARRIRDDKIIPYRSIPHFPASALAVEGHAGELHLGFWGKVPVAVLAGRLHLYQGYSPAQVVFPARVLARAGIEFLVATCAAGGIGREAAPGSFMIFSDHLNWQGQNPLVGPHDPRWGPRFVDMSEAYDRELRRTAKRVAAGLLGRSRGDVTLEDAAGRRGDAQEHFRHRTADVADPQIKDGRARQPVADRFGEDKFDLLADEGAVAVDELGD